MCRSGTDMRAMEEEAILDVLCEGCLARVDRKLQRGGSLSDHRLGEYGFCGECSKRIKAVLKKLEAEAVADAQGATCAGNSSD